jgi:hypothetical protein
MAEPDAPGLRVATISLLLARDFPVRGFVLPPWQWYNPWVHGQEAIYRCPAPGSAAGDFKNCKGS